MDQPLTSPALRALDDALHAMIGKSRAEQAPPLEVRCERLARLRGLISDNEARLTQAISADFGNRSATETLFAEILFVLNEIKHASKHLKKWMAPQRVVTALQFLPDHDRLFPRLAAMLAPGGVFAAQMPSAARESSHALMRMVAADGPWWSRLAPVVKSQPLIAAFENYYEWLTPVASRIDLWMTTYVHVFDSPESIVDWFAGSPLQPFLGRLSDEERRAYLDRYRKEMREAYPMRSDGKVLFAYPRLFIVATRG